MDLFAVAPDSEAWQVLPFPRMDGFCSQEVFLGRLRMTIGEIWDLEELSGTRARIGK